MRAMVIAHWLPVPGKPGWYYCSKCGGMIPHKGKMPVEVINRFCRKCGVRISDKAEMIMPRRAAIPAGRRRGDICIIAREGTPCKAD